MRVLGNRVVVSPVEEQNTQGAIYLPETFKVPMSVGIVEAIGPGPRLENGKVVAIPLVVGDKVSYRSWSEETVDGFRFVISDEVDVVFRDGVAIPLWDRILVSIPERAEGFAGDLALPESFLEAYYEATVIAVGPGRRTLDGGHRPIDVQVGETVRFFRYSGIPIEHKGNKFFVIRQSNLIGVLEC